MIAILIVMVSLAGATVGLVLFNCCNEYFAKRVQSSTHCALETLFGISGAVLAVVWCLVYLGMENLL